MLDFRLLGRFVALGLGISIMIAGSVGGAAAEIKGVFEEPAGIGSGVGNIRGWAYTTLPSESILPRIEVFIDGVVGYEVPCCTARGDVKGVYPDAPLDSGFSGVFNWALLEPGIHEISIVVKSTAGEEKTFSNTIETVRFEGLEFMLKFRSTPSSTCDIANEPPADGNAILECSNLVGEKAGAGTLFECAGKTAIAWDTASQAFKIVDSCEADCTDDADCDDGLFCTGVETCNVVTGECEAVSACAPSIDGCVIRDGFCDEDLDICLDVADDAACDDGLFCGGIETCDVTTGGCVAVSSCPPSFPIGCMYPGGYCNEVTDTCDDFYDDDDCPGPSICVPVGDGGECTV